MKPLLLACAATLVWQPTTSRGYEIYYYAALTGAAAVPPNSSSATGTALVYIDTTLQQLHFDVVYEGLSSAVTGANLYGLTSMPGMGSAGPATPDPLPGFATGTPQGIYHGVFDLTFSGTYSNHFLVASGGTAAQAQGALGSGLASGHTYFSIATASYPAGELRGFLAPAPTTDFDHNGRVDEVDMNLWKIGFGPSTFADADHDGDTDGADFLDWQRQVGQVAQVPGHHHATPAGQLVPEPAAAAVAAIGFAGVLAIRRGRGGG